MTRREERPDMIWDENWDSWIQRCSEVSLGRDCWVETTGTWDFLAANICIYIRWIA